MNCVNLIQTFFHVQPYNNLKKLQFNKIQILLQISTILENILQKICVIDPLLTYNFSFTFTVLCSFMPPNDEYSGRNILYLQQFSFAGPFLGLLLYDNFQYDKSIYDKKK